MNKLILALMLLWPAGLLADSTASTDLNLAQAAFPGTVTPTGEDLTVSFSGAAGVFSSISDPTWTPLSITFPFATGSGSATLNGSDIALSETLSAGEMFFVLSRRGLVTTTGPLDISIPYTANLQAGDSLFLDLALFSGNQTLLDVNLPVKQSTGVLSADIPGLPPGTYGFALGENFSSFAAVPEPGSLLLLACGIGLVARTFYRNFRIRES